MNGLSTLIGVVIEIRGFPPFGEAFSPAIRKIFMVVKEAGGGPTFAEDLAPLIKKVRGRFKATKSGGKISVQWFIVGDELSLTCWSLR